MISGKYIGLSIRIQIWSDLLIRLPMWRSSILIAPITTTLSCDIHWTFWIGIGDLIGLNGDLIGLNWGDEIDFMNSRKVAQWAHMHRFQPVCLSVCLSALTEGSLWSITTVWLHLAYHRLVTVYKLSILKQLDSPHFIINHKRNLHFIQEWYSSKILLTHTV